MSWQDYEYGPADDGSDHFIDAGWLPPEDAEELQEEVKALKAEIRRLQVDYMLVFVAGCILGIVGLCMALSILGFQWN